MDDRLQYASMLEIPVNTCNVTYKQGKKKVSKRKKEGELLKEQVLKKVNEQQLQEKEEQFCEQPVAEKEEAVFDDETKIKPRKKLKLKFSIIGVQLALIIGLTATILITNALYPNSGINVFMRGVFGVDGAQSVDERVYTDFSPVISSQGVLSVNDGVITVTGEGSVYSSCEGEVTSLTQSEDGTFTMEIMHSSNFSSVFSGLNYAYCEVGDKVFGTIPVGFVNEQVSLCFKNSQGVVINDYTVEGNAVIWAV